MGIGYVEVVTHDYKRHGTTTLFAALSVLNGAFLASCKPRHRLLEFTPAGARSDAAVRDWKYVLTWSDIYPLRSRRS